MKESVTPAQARVHCLEIMSTVDSGLRRNDEENRRNDEENRSNDKDVN